MKLSSKNFLGKLEAGELKIAFVGMSNIGKTHLTKRLCKSHKFKKIDVDKMIWEKLGFDDMEDFADWQGQPYEEGYAEREADLIKMEAEATQKAIKKAKGNTIIDTTGSIVYIDPAVRRELKEACYVVHIKAEPSDLERLKWDYFDNPKPLIWGRQYKPRPDRTDRENIFECYPKLLMSRAKDYAAMADSTIASRDILDGIMTEDEIIKAIKPPR
jgi:shikimate kinase